jgi:hypothetical protein
VRGRIEPHHLFDGAAGPQQLINIGGLRRPPGERRVDFFVENRLPLA